MRSPFLAPVVSVLVFASVVACNKPSTEEQVKGTWKVTDVQLPAAVASSPMAKQQKDALMSATFEIKPDKKYVMQSTVAVEGTWTVAGNSLTLTPQTVAGQTIQQVKDTLTKMGQGAVANNIGASMVMTLSEDGKTLTGNSNGGSLKLAKN